jgi:hypothetical protein
MAKRNTADRRASGASTKRKKDPGGVFPTKWGPIRTLPRNADDDERFASEVDRLRYVLVLRDIFDPARIRQHELQAILPKRLKKRGVKVKEVDAYLARLPAKRHNQTAPARKGRAARRAERDAKLRADTLDLRSRREWSISAIAKRLHIGRDRVREYLAE